MSKVSILIPCFNAEDYVGEAIESALNQTYRDIEVVVVDDGSKDGSVEVLKSFGERIRYEAAPNRGACAARNRAFELSQGVFVQYLDADDLLCPEKIETQLPLLKNGPADLVFCKGYIFGDGKPERPKKRAIKDPTGIDPFVYCLSQGLATEGPLIKRSIIEKVGGFDEALRRGQEWDFHVRLAAAGARIALVPEHLYRHRHDDRPGRITRRKIDKDYFTKHFITLGKKLRDQDRYLLNQERATAFCSLLVSSAVGSFRDGDRAIAKEAFALAESLDPTRSYRFPGRGFYRQICRRIGVSNTESMLRPLRELRRRLRGRGI